MGSLRRRRSEDRPGEDHSSERSIDWRQMAPKWLLLAMLTVSVGFNAAMGSMLWGAVDAASDAKFAAVEAKFSDPRWQMLADHSEAIGILGARSKQHDDQLAGARQAQEDVARVREEMRLLRQTIDSMNARLARKGI
jgi:hypothetical protein